LFLVPCLHGTCLNKEGNYECTCAKTFTGKNCNLQADACANKPCNNSDLCVLSELDNSGYQCVPASQQIEMFYKTNLDISQRFDIEKEIEELLKAAPKKNPDVQTVSRKKLIINDGTTSFVRKINLIGECKCESRENLEIVHWNV